MWGAVMSKVHADLEPKEFEVSSYAVEKYYCTSTGNIATTACPSKAIGWYKKSNVPPLCTAHSGDVAATPADVRKAEAEAEAASKAAASSSDAAASSAASSN